MASNAAARAVYAHWGFRDEVLVLAAPVAVLAERLGAPPSQPSFGSIHVQTDDVDRIVKAVEMYVPRLPGRSAGSIVTQPRGGYVTVYDDVCDRDPAMLRRLAKDVSSRTGLVVITVGIEEEAVVRMILFDRGGIVDEYASVPEFHGPLPPGRGDRAAREPRRRRALHGRHAGGGSRGDARRRLSRRPAAGARAARRPRRRLGLSGAEHGWADAPEADAVPSGSTADAELVDAPRCPYCARVRIMLAEKGVAHEPVVIDLRIGLPGSTS